MANIYLCGHGEWATKGAKSGFGIVPKGTSVSFYTPVGRFLSITQVQGIMGGTGLPADQKFLAYQSATDVMLHPAPEMRGRFARAAAATGARVAFADRPTRLSELMERYAGNDLHWCACRVRFEGKDTTEGGYNDDYFPSRGVGV
jgi:hypothetical protein